MNLLSNILLFISGFAALINLVFVFYKTHKIKHNLLNSNKRNIDDTNKISAEYINQDRQDVNYDEINKLSISVLSSNSDTAVKYFSPILKKIQYEFNQPVFFADYFETHIFKNWILKSILVDLEYSCSAGVLRYYDNIFLFYIFINKNLLIGNSLTLKGRIAITHEFCHFLSCLFLFSEIPQKEFLEKFKNSMNKKLFDLTNKDLNELYNLLSNRYDMNIYDKHTIFSDSHFRLDDDTVKLNYSTLYVKLLFPYSDFMNIFDKRKQNEFDELYKSNKKDIAINVYGKCIKELIDKSDLPKEFLVQQAQAFLHNYMGEKNLIL
jgi:hypothetical protein